MSKEAEGNSTGKLKDFASSSSDHEILDVADEMSHYAAKEEIASQSNKSSRSGRKAIPKSWTRVIKVDGNDDADIELFPIQDDLQFEYPATPATNKTN